MNKIIKFHIDNDYYVKIKPLPNLVGCCAIFPPNLLTNQPGYFKTYIVGENPDSIEVFVSPSTFPSKIIYAHKTIIRLLITEDILLNTVKRGISRHLMIIDGGLNNVFNVLKIQLSPAELELEKDLCIRFRELLLGKDRKGVALDYSGFEEVLKCFENGGL
jgi:hypothetical protein